MDPSPPPSQAWTTNACIGGGRTHAAALFVCMQHATCDMQHHPPFPFLLLPSSHPSSLPPIHPPTEFSPQLTAAPHQWTLFCGENAPFPPDAGGGVDTNHHHHQCTPLSMRPEPFVWYRMQSICITSTSTAQHSTAHCSASHTHHMHAHHMHTSHTHHNAIHTPHELVL